MCHDCGEPEAQCFRFQGAVAPGDEDAFYCDTDINACRPQLAQPDAFTQFLQAYLYDDHTD